MSYAMISDYQPPTSPQIQSIVTRVVGTLRLATVKAVAHSTDPKRFPLAAAPGSLEHIFLERFSSLKPQQQQHAASKVSAILAAPEPVRARTLGGLTSIDLHSASPVVEQVHGVALPVGSAIDLSKLGGLLAARYIAPAQTAQAAATPPQQNTVLEFRLRKVFCAHETDEPSPADTIAMGGVTVDETADVRKIPEFMVSGNFDKGESVVYSPPKTLAKFDIRQGGNKWPKTYTVSLILAEKDTGGFATLLQKILPKVKDAVDKELGKALGGIMPPEIASIVAEVASAVIDAFIHWILNIFNDDVFPPIATKATLYSYGQKFANGTSTSAEKSRSVVAHGGKYWVYFDWALHA